MDALGRPVIRRRDAGANLLSDGAPPPVGELPIDWMADRVVAHGLSSLAMDCGWFADQARAGEFRARMAEHDLTFLASVSANLAATEDECGDGQYDPEWSGRRVPEFDIARATPVQSGWTGDRQFDIVTRAMKLASSAGARILSIVHGAPGRPNHYTEDPTIDVQIDRMIRNLKTLIPIADSLGLTITTENHMDYRCAELARVLEGVGSPTVRHLFDFDDSIAVNEEPLDAVRHVAEYTVATHLRDMRIQPITEIATGAQRDPRSEDRRRSRAGRRIASLSERP